MAINKLSSLLVMKVAVVLIYMGGCSPLCEDDIIGTWQLAENSRGRLLPNDQSKHPTFTFRSDGTFAAEDVPIDMVSFAGQGDTLPMPLVSAAGRWNLSRGNSNHLVNLVFTEYTDTARHHIEFGNQLFDRTLWGSPELTFYRGDPDLTIVISFEKEK